MSSIVITVTNVSTNSTAGNNFRYKSLGSILVNPGNVIRGDVVTVGVVGLFGTNFGGGGASFGLSVASVDSDPSGKGIS